MDAYPEFSGKIALVTGASMGRYNEGKLVGEWVKFPISPKELHEVFQRISLS